MKCFNIFIWVFLLHFTFSFCLAQEEGEEMSIYKMLNMELEQLMEVTIVSVVDADENLRTSTIYRIYEKDIINRGYYALEDILNDIPSFSSIADDFALTGSQRGIAGNFQKTLLIVDGRVMQGLHDMATFISHQIATHNISKIEFIQGPSGVRYGTNAYAGAIFVHTKSQNPNFSGMEVQVEAGSQMHKAVNIIAAKKIKDLRLTASLRFFDANSWNFSDFVQDSLLFSANFPAYANGAMNETLEGKVYKNKKQAIPFTFSAKYKNFYAGINFYRNYSQNKGLCYVNLTYDNNEDNRKYGHYYAGWQHRINGKHLVNVEYQHYREKIWGQNHRYDNNVAYFDTLFNQQGRETFLTPEEIDESFGLEYGSKSNSASYNNKLQVYFNTFFDKAFCFHVGYTISSNKVVGTTAYQYPFSSTLASSFVNDEALLPSYKYIRNALFFDFEKSFFNDKLFLITGSRLNIHSQYGFLPVFKSGLIYMPKKDTYIKMFFNQGFREPLMQELIDSLGVFRTDLRPERIDNIEFSVLHQLTRVFQASFAVYNSQISQMIALEEKLFQNQKAKQHIQGIETQLNYRLIRWQAMFGYTYVHSRFANQLYKHRLSASFTYRIIPDISFNAKINYFSAINAVEGLPESETMLQFPAATLLNLTLATQRLKVAKKIDMRLMLTLKNALNVSFYQPNIMQTGPRQFLQPGQQIIGRLILKYN
ncbi:MAG: TonB-dependent receptor plug domain-containing protein [Chitinophagales bacterium]